jgi:pyruvate dehydrogenase E1 component
MAANPKLIDIDQQETDEWIESLHSVLERDGIDRAHYLLETLIEEARRSGAYLPYSANTAYLNTIPETKEAYTPGDPFVSGMVFR